MGQSDELMRENEALRERLSRLSQASLRINESLELDTVLQGVLDSACALTRARYGVLSLLDEDGGYENFLAFGMSPAETEWLWSLPEGLELFEYFGKIPSPMRLQDMLGHMQAMGLPEFHPPLEVSSPLSLLAAPINHRGERVGSIFVAETGSGRAFSPEDEETLVMFASQAALVIANARRYRDQQRAKNDLETLINTSPVGVVVFDAKSGVPVSFNREARRIVGNLQLPGRSLEELLEIMSYRRADGRETDLDQTPLARALSAGETVHLEEIVLQVPDGRNVSALINATPMLSNDGQLQSYVVTLQDLTPLEDLERLRAEFMGMVSHELQIPLTSIKGSATTLLDESSALDPAEIRQFHRIISDQADSMRSLISDLLDVARIETGTLAVFPEPSSPMALVDDAKRLFINTGRSNNIHVDLGPNLPQVMADRRRIGQVISNLLSNAAKHSSERAPIRISVLREEFQVVFAVTDEGRGIPADRLPFLFKKFSRLNEEERKSGASGSGFGLAICKGIVEGHGGRIWAESDGLGLGARFTFTIPAVEGENLAAPFDAADLDPQQEEAAGERKRILAVDDDPQALRYIRDALSKAGYDPILSAEPADVEQLMNERKPHLVLLDLMFPEVDGIDLMKRILEKTDVPVIFLSAYGQEGVVARAFDMGAVDYVVKPFAPTELAARIRAALRRRAGIGRHLQFETYVRGDLTIDYSEREVTLAGRPVRLTATEYAMLFELSTNAGLVLTHDQLLHQVWGEGNTGESGLVRTIVKRLRQKLGDDARSPLYVFTQPRVGYSMKKSETEEQGEA